MGRPMKDGKPVADDVSGYKQLALQLYATGVDSLRVEFVSHGQGINITAGFPQLPIRLKSGLNTYVIPLKGVDTTFVGRESRHEGSVEKVDGNQHQCLLQPVHSAARHGLSRQPGLPKVTTDEKNNLCNLWIALALHLYALVAFAQEQKFANLGDFKLQNGGVIRNCRIGYRTFGTLK